MTDVFISYSRRDKVFTQKLVDALLSAQREVWADWASIPAASDWDAEIKEGIEKTNTVLFVLSPEWIKSNECRKEMDHAIKMGKRMVPILHIMPAEGQEVPPELAKLNWVYMRESDDFDEAFVTLQSAMDTDLDWIKTHTRIQVRALEWEKKNRSASFALRGEDLTEGEQFIASGAEKRPIPTHLQSEFVLASRKDATRRQRQTLAGVTVALVVSIALSIYAVIQQREAVRQAQISRVGELAAQSVSLREKNFLLSLLLGVEAYKETKRIPASLQLKSDLLENTQTNPQLERFLIGHTASVNSVAFSPDGKTLASSSIDSTIFLWDVESGKPISQMSKQTGSVNSVAFSPNGKILASGSDDNTILLWDVASGQPIAQLSKHTGGVKSVAFSPDGKTLASGSDDNTIILWDVESRQSIDQLSEHTDGVNSVVFSPNGKFLASGSYDSSIILWDVEDVEIVKPINQPLHGLTNYVLSLAFSPDDKTLASGSNYTAITLTDSKPLTSDSSDGTIILWDIASSQPIGQHLHGHTDSVFSVAFSPDSKTLASGSYDGTIILWDVEYGKPIVQLFEHKGSVNSVAFSPDGKTLASGSDDSTIILWDVSDIENVTLIGRLNEHTARVTSLAFSPDGKTLASGSNDSTIILWDVTDIEHSQLVGEPLRRHEAGVNSVAFSLDGKTLASESYDSTIILWDVTDIKNVKPIDQPLHGLTDYVFNVAFSPDSKTLAFGSDDNTIILWNVASDKLIDQLSDHTSGVNNVAFSPDGRTLASSGINGSNIILWDIESRQPIGQPLQGYGAGVHSMAFSPDGNTLASGSDDNTIILWMANPETWTENACQRAGRNFTRAEWTQYFPNEEYRKTCEQWDLEPEPIPTATP